MIERATEVVEDGKELAQQLLVRVLGPISQLLARPTLVVLEVRSQPLVAREHGLRVVASGLQFGVHSLLRGGSGLGVFHRARPGIDNALAARLTPRNRLVGGLVFRGPVWLLSHWRSARIHSPNAP